MVTIILGIIAAAAIPCYMSIISSTEAATEDAIISNIKIGLEIYATDMLIMSGHITFLLIELLIKDRMTASIIGPMIQV